MLFSEWQPGRSAPEGKMVLLMFPEAEADYRLCVGMRRGESFWVFGAEMRQKARLWHPLPEIPPEIPKEIMP